MDILIVEDEAEIAQLVQLFLEQEGFQCRTCGNGLAALEAVRQQPPDLIVLDWMIPGLDGLEVCARVRQQTGPKDPYILMLTAKSTEGDKVGGLEVGADDYVTKPFSPRELLLRVRAVARRQQDQGVAKPGPVKAGGIELDRSSMTATMGKKKLVLTSTEYRLLDLLARRAGTIQSREALLSEVWGYQASLDTRTVDTHVRRLREKLGKAGAVIQTVRGSGYRLGVPTA